MSPRIEVDASAGEGVSLEVSLDTAEAAVRYVLGREEVETAEISLAFVGDAEIAALNRSYLSHEGATDVISFALHTDGDPPLGDVYVGADQAARQAAELGVPESEELLRLAIHGTLHVLGYDHPEDADRSESEMYRRQEELLIAFLERVGASGR